MTEAGLPCLGMEPAADPFGTYFVWDVLRVIVGVFGVLFTMLCARIAYLIWKRDDPDVGDLTAWLAHSLFALTATALMADEIGREPHVLLVLSILAALVLGTVSMLNRLSWPPGLWRTQHKDACQASEAERRVVAEDKRAADARRGA